MKGPLVSSAWLLLGSDWFNWVQMSLAGLSYVNYVNLCGTFFTCRTISILENVCQNSQKESFFSALWGCVLHSSQVRLAALTFVLGHLGKPNANFNKNYVTGNNKPLMVSVLLRLDHNHFIICLLLSALSAKQKLQK